MSPGSVNAAWLYTPLLHRYRSDFSKRLHCIEVGKCVRMCASVYHILCSVGGAVSQMTHHRLHTDSTSVLNDVKYVFEFVITTINYVFTSCSIAM